MRNIQLLSKLNKPQNGLCNVRYITYLKITFPSFMTYDNSACLSIPTKPILLYELRKTRYFCLSLLNLALTCFNLKDCLTPSIQFF